MIRLIFTYNRDVLNFLIRGKEIYYTDRKWKNWLRCLPVPEGFIKQIKMSRNKIPAFIGNLFNFTDEEMAQYEKAKGEKELAQIIIADAKSKGCRLLSENFIDEKKDGNS